MSSATTRKRSKEGVDQKESVMRWMVNDFCLAGERWDSEERYDDKRSAPILSLSLVVYFSGWWLTSKRGI